MPKQNTNGLRPGWRRHPKEPHHCIEHDSGRLRITKALIFDRAQYTVWIRDNNEFIRPNLQPFENATEAMTAAENLI